MSSPTPAPAPAPAPKTPQAVVLCPLLVFNYADFSEKVAKLAQEYQAIQVTHAPLISIYEIDTPAEGALVVSSRLVASLDAESDDKQESRSAVLGLLKSTFQELTGQFLETPTLEVQQELSRVQALYSYLSREESG